MNLVFDIGNTTRKWAAFEGQTPVASGHWDDGAAWSGPQGSQVDRVLVAASGNCDLGAIAQATGSSRVERFSTDLPLPVRLDYRTPQTLGADRVADACGARALHPGEHCLIIDAGTCITVDYLAADATYHGGAIMPGLAMNLKALHTFTAKLPLIDLDGERKAPLLGRTTEESIVAGTLGATLLALAGFVAAYRAKFPSLRVLLTGGDAPRLTAGAANGWETVPDLTLRGLNEIVLYRDNPTR